MKKVLLAVDGSSESKKALERAFNWMDSTDELIILYVIDTSSYDYEEIVPMIGGGISTETSTQLIDREKKRITPIINEWMQLGQDCGFKNISARIIEGVPREKICEEAEIEKVELIMMGARGMGRMKRLLLGSVSDYVTHNAKCTVCICK